MTRSRRAALPLRVLIAVAGLVPVLAGCEAGNNAPVLQWHQPTPGAGTQFGQISIRNVFILGAPLNATLARGQSTGMFMALVNNGSPDRLISVTAPAVARTITLPGGSVRLPTRAAVLLTGPVPKIILTGLTRPVSSGTSVRVTMTFQNAGTITLSVPVLPRAHDYGTFSPAPSPSPTATASKPGHRHHSATPSPTPSPSSS